MERSFNKPGKALWASAALVMAMLFFGPAVQAGKVQEFSAEQVVIGPDGTKEHTGEIFFSHGKMRMQSFMPGSPGEMIMILRQDKKLQWMLNTEEKTYFERELKEDEFKEMMKSHVDQESVTDLGTETINGYKCRKQEMTVTVTFMGRTQTSKSTVWKSDKFDIPLRTRNEDGSMTELRSIKEGKQPESLFEIPEGYTKVAGMMELFSDQERPARKRPGRKMEIPKELRDQLPEGFELPVIPSR